MIRPLPLKPFGRCPRAALPGRFDVLAKLARDQKMPMPLRAEAIVGLADDAVKRRWLLFDFAVGDQPVLSAEAMRSLRGNILTEQESLRICATKIGELKDRIHRVATEPATDLDGLAWPARGTRRPCGR